MSYVGHFSNREDPFKADMSPYLVLLEAGGALISEPGNDPSNCTPELVWALV